MSRSASRAIAYAAVAFSACSWGTWSLWLRHAESIAAMPASLESTLVMASMTVTSGAVALWDRTRSPARWSTRLWVGWLGISDAFNVLLFFAAYKITIGVSVLAHYFTPALVAIGSPFVVRERLSPRTIVAVAVSLSGLFVMLAPGGSSAGGSAIVASALLGAGSAAFYAGNVLANKFVIGAFSTSETMFWHGVVATPLLAAFVPIEAYRAIDPRAAGFLALIAVWPGTLAGLSFIWGLRRIPAAHASTLTLLEPVVAVALGAVVFGEPLGPRTVAGGALILGGAMVILLGQGAGAGRSTDPNDARAGRSG